MENHLLVSTITPLSQIAKSGKLSKIFENPKKLNGYWIDIVPIPIYFPFHVHFYLIF